MEDKKSSKETSGSLPPVFDSAELFGRHTTIMIKHGEQIYRLMITRQDKLILNK